MIGIFEQDAANIKHTILHLAAGWLLASDEKGYFMPDEEGDKIARTRTAACARQLLAAVFPVGPNVES